jgi:hypothetical protein
MYPNLSFNESTAALNDWYKLFLVPGAAHCAPNPDQPNGPFPQTNLAILIDWVEKGVEPITLNATVLQGEQIGKNEQMSALLASREFESHLRVAESHLDCARRVFSHRSRRTENSLFLGQCSQVYHCLLRMDFFCGLQRN